MQQYYLNGTYKVLFNYEKCIPYEDAFGTSDLYIGVTDLFDLTPEESFRVAILGDDITVFREGNDEIYKSYCLSDLTDTKYETFNLGTSSNKCPLFAYTHEQNDGFSVSTYQGIYPLTDLIDLEGADAVRYDSVERTLLVKKGNDTFTYDSQKVYYQQFSAPSTGDTRRPLAFFTDAHRLPLFIYETAQPSDDPTIACKFLNAKMTAPSYDNEIFSKIVLMNDGQLKVYDKTGIFRTFTQV